MVLQTDWAGTTNCLAPVAKRYSVFGSRKRAVIRDEIDQGHRCGTHRRGRDDPVEVIAAPLKGHTRKVVTPSCVNRSSDSRLVRQFNPQALHSACRAIRSPHPATSTSNTGGLRRRAAGPRSVAKQRELEWSCRSQTVP